MGILAAVGLLLAGVLGLVGQLLSALGLGGLVNGLLGGLGIKKLLGGLGLGGISESLGGGKEKKKGCRIAANHWWFDGRWEVKYVSFHTLYYQFLCHSDLLPI